MSEQSESAYHDLDAKLRAAKKTLSGAFETDPPRVVNVPLTWDELDTINEAMERGL